MATGIVKFYNEGKGYGFIKPIVGRRDVYVDRTAVKAAGLTTLPHEASIEYEIGVNSQDGPNRGKEQAIRVRLL